MIDFNSLHERLQNAQSVLITSKSSFSLEVLYTLSVLNDLIIGYYRKYSLVALSKVLSLDEQVILSGSGLDFQNVTNHIEGLKYIIQIPKTDKTKIDSVTYDEDEENFYFHISPSNTSDFNTENISIIKDEPEFDLIIIVDTDDLEQIGSIYTETSQVFREDKLFHINSNDSSSLMQCLVEYISKLDNYKPKKEIAQSILRGLLINAVDNNFTSANEQLFLDIAKAINYNANFKEAYDFVSELKKEKNPQPVKPNKPAFNPPPFPSLRDPKFISRPNQGANFDLSSGKSKDNNQNIFNPSRL